MTQRYPARRRVTGPRVRRHRLAETVQLRPGPPSPMRTYLTAREVLDHNPRWTDLDKVRLTAFLEDWGEELTSIYHTSSSRILVGLDQEGRKLFEIHPGLVRLANGDRVLQLSRAPWRTPRKPRRPVTPRSQIKAPPAFCAVHHEQLPASGRCDRCA